MCTTSAFAQLPTGTILGSVRDATGAVLPGASITLRNANTGATRTVLTSETGAYRVPALTVGRYDITVELPGFNTAVEQGALQFRAEFFNLFNHPNFGTLNNAVFAGNGPAAGGAVEAPLASAGQILSTRTRSRQIQLALKIVF